MLWYGTEQVLLTASMTQADIVAAFNTIDALRASTVDVVINGAGDWTISFSPLDVADTSYEVMKLAEISQIADADQSAIESQLLDNHGRVQNLTLSTGPVTLWYGDKAIDISVLSAAAIEATLEKFDTIDDVHVTGSGSAADPWQVTFLQAEQSDDGGEAGEGEVWRVGGVI